MSLEELRVIHMSYWDFDGAVHEGKMIVNQAWATQLCGVFEKIFDARFPIYRMDPVDYLAKSDSGLEASSNTMSFNARSMRGGNKWSQRAYSLTSTSTRASTVYQGRYDHPPAGARLCRSFPR